MKTIGRVIRPEEVEIPVDEKSAWRSLMSAVIIQAIEETKSPDITQALDAMTFIRSKEFGLWLEGAGLPFGELSLKQIPQAWRLIKNKRR